MQNCVASVTNKQTNKQTNKHISNKIQEDTAFEWTQKGLLRFYYSEMFNTKLGSRRYSTSNKNEQKSSSKSVQCMYGLYYNLFNIFAI